MALVKINCSLVVSRRYLRYVLSNKKRCSTIRQFSSFRNEILRHKQNFPPLLSVSGFRYVKSHVYEVLYSSKSVKNRPLNLESAIDYENVAEETLQSLYDRFEEVLQYSHFEDWDVNYSNGVLTITLEKNCVYVINKQTPNRQIWLSSPVSGPKRYDYMNGTWIYKRDGLSLHQLLTDELSQMLQNKADFFICNYSS